MSSAPRRSRHLPPSPRPVGAAPRVRPAAVRSTASALPLNRSDLSYCAISPQASAIIMDQDEATRDCLQPSASRSLGPASIPAIGSPCSIGCGGVGGIAT